MRSQARTNAEQHTAKHTAAMEVSTFMVAIEKCLVEFDGGQAFTATVEQFGKGTISVVYLVAGYFMTRDILRKASQEFLAKNLSLPADQEIYDSLAPEIRPP